MTCCGAERPSLLRGEGLQPERINEYRSVVVASRGDFFLGKNSFLGGNEITLSITGYE